MIPEDEDESMSHTQLVHKAVASGLTAWPAGHWSRPKQERDLEARRICVELHARSRRGELPRSFVEANAHLFRDVDPAPKLHGPSWLCRGLYAAMRALYESRHGGQLGEVTNRHLLYHVCPLDSNDDWLLNVQRLARGVDVFNGRRVVAVSTGAGMVPPDEVRRYLPPCDVVEVRNDRWLREVASFPRLLEEVHGTDSSSAVFYAHTKGNSTQNNRLGAARWRNAMYTHLLDRSDECLRLLQTYTAVGTHRMVWPRERMSPYPSRLRHGRWMFAGTFFWFRRDAVYRRRWRDVPQDRYGAEAWLSGMLSPWTTISVFQPWPELRFPTPSPYDPDLYGEEYDQ